MKFKALTTAIIAILLSNVALFATPDNKRGKAKKKQGDRLVSMLPASDGVVVFEAKRFLDEGLPRVLSANPTLLGHITGHIDAMREKAGIDVRKFDRVAFGVAYMEGPNGTTDYEPVLIGTATELNFDALVAAAKTASGGTGRTETIAGKSVFIFKIDPSKFAKQPNAAAAPKVAGAVDRIFEKDFAITAIDRNTIAVGTLDRVKDTLEAKGHVSAELTGLLASQAPGVMAFAMRPPGGMAKILPLESDELGKTIDSIQYIAGSLDVTAVGADLHVLGRTKTAADAAALSDLLKVGKSFGQIAFAGKKRADQQVYYRLINNAKLGIRGNDVTVDVAVPQADVDVLVAGIK